MTGICFQIQKEKTQTEKLTKEEGPLVDSWSDGRVLEEPLFFCMCVGVSTTQSESEKELYILIWEDFQDILSIFGRSKKLQTDVFSRILFFIKICKEKDS